MPPKKSKKPKRRVLHAEDEKELEFKKDGEGYGSITKPLGNNRFMVFSYDLEKEISCHARGNIRGKNRKDMRKDCVVLFSFRNLNNEYDIWKKTNDCSGINMKGDIIYVYTEKDVKDLKRAGEIPENYTVNDSIFLESKSSFLNIEKSDQSDDDGEPWYAFKKQHFESGDDWLNSDDNKVSSSKNIADKNFDEIINFI